MFNFRFESQKSDLDFEKEDKYYKHVNACLVYFCFIHLLFSPLVLLKNYNY